MLHHLVLEILLKSLCGQVSSFKSQSFLIMGVTDFSKRPCLAQITSFIRKHQTSDLSIQH